MTCDTIDIMRVCVRVQFHGEPLKGHRRLRHQLPQQLPEAQAQQRLPAKDGCEEQAQGAPPDGIDKERPVPGTA